MSGSYVQPKTKAFKLGGTVAPFSYVKFLTTGTADDVVVQAGAGDHIAGICQVGGSSGEIKEVDLPGGGSKLKIAATVTRGQWLKSDAGGLGTPGTTSADFCGAQAHASGVLNDVVPVFIHPVVIAAAE